MTARLFKINATFNEFVDYLNQDVYRYWLTFLRALHYLDQDVQRPFVLNWSVRGTRTTVTKRATVGKHVVPSHRPHSPQRPQHALCSTNMGCKRHTNNQVSKSWHTV